MNELRNAFPASQQYTSFRSLSGSLREKNEVSAFSSLDIQRLSAKQALSRFSGQSANEYSNPHSRLAPPLSGGENTFQPSQAYGLPARSLHIRASLRKLDSSDSDKDVITTSRQVGDSSESSSDASAHGNATVEGSIEGSVNSEKDNPDQPETDNMTRPKGMDGETLSDSEVRVLRELERRDAEVRTHEQAHLVASAGMAVGGANYQYTTGPDGKRYVSGGDVSIDASEGNTPDETVQKMQRVRAAAMAPANPSAQDRRVASIASQRATRARQEAVELEREMSREKQEADHAEQSEAEQSVPESTTENADATDTKNTDSIVDPFQQARNSYAANAYSSNQRPEPLTPETRAAQPASPRRSGFGLITNVRPPSGSLADFPALGQVR